MKKLTSILLAVVMSILCLTFTACDKEEKEKENLNETAQEVVTRFLNNFNATAEKIEIKQPEFKGDYNLQLKVSSPSIEALGIGDTIKASIDTRLDGIENIGVNGALDLKGLSLQGNFYLKDNKLYAHIPMLSEEYIALDLSEYINELKNMPTFDPKVNYDAVKPFITNIVNSYKDSSLDKKATYKVFDEEVKCKKLSLTYEANSLVTTLRDEVSKLLGKDGFIDIEDVIKQVDPDSEVNIKEEIEKIFDEIQEDTKDKKLVIDIYTNDNGLLGFDLKVDDKSYITANIKNTDKEYKAIITSITDDGQNATISLDGVKNSDKSFTGKLSIKNGDESQLELDIKDFLMTEKQFKGEFSTSTKIEDKDSTINVKFDCVDDKASFELTAKVDNVDVNLALNGDDKNFKINASAKQDSEELGSIEITFAEGLSKDEFTEFDPSMKVKDTTIEELTKLFEIN